MLVKRTVYAVVDNGNRSVTDFGMGPGVLYKDELHYTEIWDELTQSVQNMLSIELNRMNDELLEKLFDIEMEVIEDEK